MNLIKYHPFAPAKDLYNFFDNVFNRNITDFFGSDQAISSPSVNVVETKDDFRIEVAAPGYEKGDFKLNLDKDQLSISVEKEENSEVKEEGKFTRREFNYTSFKRSFQLPDTINADAIGAAYEQGILTITLPKAEVKPEEEAKVIEVK